MVITGLGVFSPFGAGKSLYWNNIQKGKSAASMIKSFDVSSLPTKFAAESSMTNAELDSLIPNPKSIKTLSRSGKFAVIAAEEAVIDSGIKFENLDAYRLGTSLGVSGLGYWDINHTYKTIDVVAQSLKESPDGKIDYALVYKNILEKFHPLTPLKALPNIPTAHIAINYNARGPSQSVSTACTSSSQSIGEAYRQIKYDYADIMIAGGSDSLINPNGLVSFITIGVVSNNNKEFRTATRPFDKRRDGFMVGEGAAIFILEEYEHCLKRGGKIYAELAGYSSTSDAFRLTDEPKEAWGSVRAMSLALEDAKINTTDVNYINAHGTGTPMNDRTETYAIKTVFGEQAYKIPVSSTKSMIGHLVAAAVAIELATCVITIKNKVITPTINYEEPDPECDLDYVPNEAREADVDVILSNSFGFGGQNACIIIKRINETE